MHHMYYNNGFLGWIMSIMHMALPILIIFFIFGFFNQKKEYRTETSLTNNPLDLLKERYVKGEITKEEFRNMKNDIKG